ncbi:hypothetical protein D3P04_12720 [Paracoccus onubensis]|uniref:Uncharacterized protein n=1 Tax=Paracoccus onubensis TaxID=1675788 RepID=A0A418SU46_9RHOB|nr:hypothetical protein D3P04_12720 [Paracoccus onubensis]
MDTDDLTDDLAWGERAEPSGEDNIFKLEAPDTGAGEPSRRAMGSGIAARMNEIGTSQVMHELGVDRGEHQIMKMTIARRRMMPGKLSQHCSYHIAMPCRSFSIPKALPMR